MDTLKAKVKRVAESYWRPALNGITFPAFDDEHGSYAVFARGVSAGKKYYNVVLHLRVVDDHVIVEAHNTDADIRADLIAAGIPAELIKQPEYIT